MKRLHVANNKLQPDKIDEEIEDIYHIHMQHARVTLRGRWDRHVLDIWVVLVAYDVGERVEAVGAQVQHQEDRLEEGKIRDCPKLKFNLQLATFRAE